MNLPIDPRGEQDHWDAETAHLTVSRLRALAAEPAHRAEAPWLGLALTLAGLVFAGLWLVTP